MSVQTEADKRLDQAESHLQATIENLHEVVIKKCSGSEEYDKDSRIKLWRLYKDLVELQLEMDW